MPATPICSASTPKPANGSTRIRASAAVCRSAGCARRTISSRTMWSWNSPTTPCSSPIPTACGISERIRTTRRASMIKTFQQLASAAVKDNYVVEFRSDLSGALEQIGYDTPMDDYSLFALKSSARRSADDLPAPDSARHGFDRPGHAGGGGIHRETAARRRAGGQGRDPAQRVSGQHLQARARQLQEGDRRGSPC